MQGLYIHVPFCKSRCVYCDFYSTVRGGEARKAYAAALANEMRLRSRYFNIKGSETAAETTCAIGGAHTCTKPVLDSIYLGGGTPSVLGEAELQVVFGAIAECFDIAPGAEITIEANPDDVDEPFAQMLKRLPINRVSMGVQTFSDSQLRLLRRRHSSLQVEQAIANLRSAGITNLSIDLIYGLPNQTLEQWCADLDKALALPISHLSAYALIYEEGTELYRMRERGEVSEAPDELSLQMFRALMERTEAAGFNHYEISNFARPSLEARHNTGYWRGMRYLGLGPGAHSYDGNSRQWNSPDLSAYLTSQGDVATAGLSEREILTLAMRKEETILTQLRTAAGIDLAAYSSQYGEAALRQLMAKARPYILDGQLSVEPVAPQSFVKRPSDGAESQGRCLCLTREGVFVSDGIMAELFD